MPRKKTLQTVKETDLYHPLQGWLEGNGYIVHAEVNDCDIVARKGDDVVIIEIKRAINLDLLLQAVKRQQASESVYVAVPAPRTADKRWNELLRLLKRLEIGLLLVYLDSILPRVELAFHPVRQERRQQKAVTKALLTEMSGRSVNMNIGGSTRRPLMTAYREEALTVAAALEQSGPASPSLLRKSGCPEKTGSILYANFYGWFERVSAGQYALTEKGRTALSEHQELVVRIRSRLKECS
jgi:Uncharacterized conserved protein